jgi:hypothetical protein
MISYSQAQSRRPANPASITVPAPSFWRDLLDAIPIVIFVRGARGALESRREKRTPR